MKQSSWVLITAIALTGCGGGGGDSGGAANETNPPALQTTVYCHGDFNRLYIHDDNGLESYEVMLRAMGAAPITATGSRNGNQLLLQASSNGATLDYDVTIAPDGATMTGTVNVAFGPNTFLLNEAGTEGDCASFDVETNGVPVLVAADFTDVAGFVQDISLLRSAAGHDYSDDFEVCRSMKHYFSPPMEDRTNDTVPVYAPFAGTVVHLATEEENFVDDGVTNQKIVIRAADNPAVVAVLFHVDLLSNSLVAGSDVTAGQQLGFARMVSGGSVSHDFDIAMHANTDAGVRYVSYFDAMPDTLFANYAGFAADRSELIISEATRDADPLSCDGETFTDSGSTPSWVYNLP